MSQSENFSNIFDEDINLKGLFEILNPENNLVLADDMMLSDAKGIILVSDVEIVAAEEDTKNPDTGANDVVGVAAALAVVSLVAAGAVSLKK